MNTSPPHEQIKKDSDHLQLLMIFHFILAGLGVLGLGFLFLHYFMMSTMLDNPAMWDRIREQQEQRHQAPMPFDPHQFIGIFRWFYLFVGAWGILSIILNTFSGFFIKARKNRLFSLIVSAVNCLNVPFGTVLGVFTIVVLVRDSVQAQYELPRS